MKWPDYATDSPKLTLSPEPNPELKYGDVVEGTDMYGRHRTGRVVSGPDENGIVNVQPL